MSRYTPEELAIEGRINVGRPWPEGPIAMLPVAQLYVRDVPLLRPPGQSEADLLQVLWCPFDHPAHPRTALFWRATATIADILEAPPEPPGVQFSTYVPEPCLLTPEQVTEYPNHMELSVELQQQLEDWSSWQVAGAAVDSSYEVAPEELYMDELSLAPGWKVGGWTRWGLSDPVPRICSVCGTEADPLLTIATTEWDADGGSWVPEEDQVHPPNRSLAPFRGASPGSKSPVAMTCNYTPAQCPRTTRTSSSSSDCDLLPR
ncbi:non-ribosomal peptide synthetase [Streptomyces xanthophaeus]